MPSFSLSDELPDAFSHCCARQTKVMSEAAKIEAKEKFDRGDYMGAAKVPAAV